MSKPTIVLGTLNDAELTTAIDNLVKHVNGKSKEMADYFDSQINRMKASLNSLGNVNINLGGTGTADKQISRQFKETTATIKDTTAAWDNFISVIQRSGRTESGFIKNFNAEDLATLKFALRDLNAEYIKINREGGGLGAEKRSAELRNQISLVDDFTRKYETAYNAMSKVGDNQATSSAAGKFAKEWTESIDKVDSRMVQLRRYFTELERASNKEIRIAFADAMKMPTRNIDEIVDKLMALQVILQHLHGTDILSAQQISAGQTKINELIASLERELQLRKEINSEGQRDPAFVDAIRQYRDGIRAAAEEARNFLRSSSVPFLYTDTSNITGSSYSSKIYAENDARSNGLTIEEQILQVVKQKHEAEKQHLATQQQITGQIQQQAQIQQGTVEHKTKKTFAEYEELRQAIAAVLQIETREVSMADSQKASYNALSVTLKQLQQAYYSLGASQRDSLNADLLIEKIHETQRAMKEIQKQMSRPISLESAMALPEKTLDEISYKMQMLRAYAQGVNAETTVGASEVRKVGDAVDALSEKAKNIQKTTKQIAIEANNIKFDKISQMPDKGIKDVGSKIRELRRYINDLKNQPILDEKNIKRAETLLSGLSDKFTKLYSVRGTDRNVNAALNMRVNTLNDIAEKMQRIQAIRGNLNTTTQKEQIEKLNQALAQLRIEQSKILGQNKDLLASNNALTRSFNYMKNRLAFYFTVGASTQFIKQLIDIRSQYEMNERALGILINSAERGTQIFKELSDMSLVSPYTLIELAGAAKQLVAYDIAAKDVVDTTRRLADMASAVGVPMERLTYALGQIKAYGYLNSRDARMFANAGIPLVKQLADYYTELEGKMVSTADVYDRMKKKAIDYNDVMAVVTKMTDEGGKFFDFQAKMADTLKVRLANLTLAWNNMLNEVGESHQGLLTGTLGVLKQLFLHWKDVSQMIYNLVYSFGLLKVGQMIFLAWSQKVGLGLAAMEVAGRRLTGVFYSLGASLRAIVTNPLTWWFALISIGVSMFQTWSRNVEEIKKLNKAIADGAQESADAMLKMMQSAEMVEARIAAKAGKLSSTEGNKAFERIREQIELSAISANDIIPTLLRIPDINERITKSFELAESIQAASDKLSDLYDKLDMSQDTILGGLFGEGLVEDIKDYSEHMKVLADNAEFAKKSNRGFWESLGNLATNIGHGISEALGNSEEEATVEITKFATNAAKVIKDELGEEGLKDKIQVGEAVARVVKEIEQQYPKISGSGKKLFETLFNETMSNEFKDAFDKNAYYYNVFLQQLKKDFGSAFRGITDSVVSESYKWSKEQQIAIDKTIAKMKNDMPDAAQETIGKLKNMLKNEEFRLRFVAEFATVTTDFQKEFETRVKKLGATFESMLKPYAPLATEELPAWTKKQQEAIAKLREENKKYEKDNSKFAKDKIAANKAEISNREKVLDLFNQSHLKDKELNKQQRAAESELQKALKNELQLIEQIRSNYKSLTKEGASHTEAIATAIDGYDETVGHINKVLGKYGIGKLDLSKFAGIQNPRELVNMLEDQVNKLLKSSTAKPEEIKELQVKVQKLKVEAKTYDLSMITKGLNNELGKLKEEYELAVELDANPELGGMFADMMGLNIETLPRTIEEYAKQYTERLNKYLRDTKSGIELPSLNLTNDDLRAFEEMVEQDKLSQAVYENIKKGVLAVRDLKKKDISETTKEWNSLIDKYGKLEAKILKITKDTSKERLNVINKFGTDEQKKNARNLVNMLSISEDPSEVSRLQTELTNLLKDVVAKNPKAVDVSGAIANEQSSLTSKAYWEDFKNSELYTMTFEDMSRNSTRAIQLIIDKLEQLKGKVKEDPASMKALSKSLQDARKELESRSSTTTLVEASKEMKAATEEVTSAKKRLAEANREVSDAEQELGSSTEGTKAYANAVERLRIARERQEEAEIEYAKSSNKAKAAQEKMKAGLETLSNELNNVQNLFKVVADLFADAGDDDTAEAINAISQGFAVMTTVIMGVVAAMVLLETTQPYLLAIAAALSVVVGLVSFLSGNSNKKITEQVEKSERAVKRLEIAYKDLEDAATHAYGAITMGVNRITLANKELQLVELKRQIQLEKSRDSKYRDQDKILDLEGQYKDLLLEIKNGVEDIVNEMLGVSSAGDAATQLVEAMIDAFREGEDAMKAFSDKWDEMIDNMILKLIISQYMQKAWDNVMKTLNDKEEEFLAKSSSDKAEAQYLLEKYSSSFGEWLVDNGLAGYSIANDETKKTIEKAYQDYLNSLRDRIAIADKANEQASEDYLKWSLDYMMGEGRDYMEGVAENLIEGLGEWYKFGDKGETSLSALQAGIQNISESTAEALESYLNIVSQRMFLHTDLLTEIRDAVQSFDMDIQVATLGQILLQLQASYQATMAMRTMMENWTVAAGNGIRVELMS